MRFLELRIPPPLVAVAIGVVMYLTVRWTPTRHFEFPGRIPLALFVAAAGVGVSLAGLWAFRRHHTTVNPIHPTRATSLVTDGIFRRCRNPMYLGLVLMLTGWALWLSTPAALPGPPLLALYLTRFQIVPEERILRVKFGSSWDLYERRVRRWL